MIFADGAISNSRPCSQLIVLRRPCWPHRLGCLCIRHISFINRSAHALSVIVYILSAPKQSSSERHLSSSLMRNMPTNPKVVSVWTSRIVPTLLAGVVAYTAYVFIKLICSAFQSIKFISCLRLDADGEADVQKP